MSSQHCAPPLTLMGPASVQMSSPRESVQGRRRERHVETLSIGRGPRGACSFSVFCTGCKIKKKKKMGEKRSKGPLPSMKASGANSLTRNLLWTPPEGSCAMAQGTEWDPPGIPLLPIALVQGHFPLCPHLRREIQLWRDMNFPRSKVLLEHSTPDHVQLP